MLLRRTEASEGKIVGGLWRHNISAKPKMFHTVCFDKNHQAMKQKGILVVKEEATVEA